MYGGLTLNTIARRIVKVEEVRRIAKIEEVLKAIRQLVHLKKARG